MSVLHNGPSIHAVGFTEKLTDATEMHKKVMSVACNADRMTSNIEELSQAKKTSKTQVLLDKQDTSETEIPPEISDVVLDMEEDYSSNKAGQDIADDLCVDFGAGGLVHVMEDNLKSQDTRQSKTFAKEYASLKTFISLENTTKALEVIQIPGVSNSAASAGLLELPAGTVSLKQGHKALVPRNIENSHNLQIKCAPVEVVKPKELVFFEEFTLNEYLEHNFELYGKKFEPVQHAANFDRDISGCIKLSDLKRATKPLGITWEKIGGILKPISKEVNIFRGKSIESGQRCLGELDINDGGVEIGRLLPSNSNQTNPLSHFPGNPVSLPSQTPVNPFFQTLQNLPPQKSEIMSHAVGDQLPLTTQNLPHQTTQNFKPQVAEQLPLQTTQNLLSRTTQNLVYQELQPQLSQTMQNQQSQAGGNALTQTTVLYQREACASYNGPGSPMSVCHDTSVSTNMNVSDVHPYTHPTHTPDPPDEFYTCSPKTKNKLRNKVGPSKGHGQQEWKITEVGYGPSCHPYLKSKEATTQVPYQTSLPHTVKDLFMLKASTDAGGI